MIKAACQNKWLNEEDIVMETLIAIRRAGADIIFTYFARDAARWVFPSLAGTVRFVAVYRSLAPLFQLESWLLPLLHRYLREGRLRGYRHMKPGGGLKQWTAL